MPSRMKPWPWMQSVVSLFFARIRATKWFRTWPVTTPTFVLEAAGRAAAIPYDSAVVASLRRRLMDPRAARVEGCRLRIGAGGRRRIDRANRLLVGRRSTRGHGVTRSGLSIGWPNLGETTQPPESSRSSNATYEMAEPLFNRPPRTSERCALDSDSARPRGSALTVTRTHYRPVSVDCRRVAWDRVAAPSGIRPRAA